jgi:hypothetical protein
MTTETATKKKTETQSLELPNNPFAFEVLQLVNKQRTSAKKVEVLQKYEHPSLKAIFIWNFDDNVVSMLPDGEVPYSTVSDDMVKSGSVSQMIEKEVEKMEAYDTKSVSYTEKIRSGHTTLRSEYTKLINFVRSASGAPGNSSINSLRRENMFIQMLEGLHPLDAEIMCLVKDKKLQTKYKITKEIVGEAYSDIKWGNR